MQCELYVDILKSRERAQQKADNDYRGDVARLLDIVRATFVCEVDRQIADVLRCMRARHPAVEIIRLKNRFVNPTPSGFRDLLLNIGVTVETATGSRTFICEVQIHHAAMLRYDRENDSHSHYEFFREYFKGSTESVQKRIQLASSMGQYAADTDLDTIVWDLVGSTDTTRLFAFKELAKLLGELEAAVIVQRRMLEIYQEHSAGGEDADTATSLNNLAELLKAQGKYDEAEPLFQQSLAIRRKVCAIHLAASSRDHSCKVLGEEHPDVATSLNNLAALLNAQGKYDESILLFTRSLEIKRKVLGEEDPDVATSLNNLAESFRSQGKYNEAEPLFQQSLAIKRKVCAIHLAAWSRDHSCKVFGEEHTDVATSLNSLAELLRAQGKYDEAEPLSQQSLAIWRKVCAIHLAAWSRDHSCKVFGEEDPAVATALNNLAGLLDTQGKYDEAEPLYQQSLAINRKVRAIHLAASSCNHSCKVLGEEHPHVATSLYNLAGLLKDQGKYDEAEPLYRRSLAIRRKVCAIHLAASSRDHSCKVFGEEHLDVATSLNNLALLLWYTGRSEEANVAGRQALAIATRALGPSHRTTQQYRKDWG
jgi:tetratricopeptide (TPR) repeat protein